MRRFIQYTLKTVVFLTYTLYCLGLNERLFQTNSVPSKAASDLPLNVSIQHYSEIINAPAKSHINVRVITTVLLLIIALVGTTGNALVVWAFRCQASSGVVSSLLILLLACVDLSICVWGIPSTIYLDVWMGPSVDWFCRWHLAYKGFVIPISACVLVVLAFERFLLICFIPGIGLTHRKLGWIFALIITIGLLSAIPMGLHGHAIGTMKEHDALIDVGSGFDRTKFAVEHHMTVIDIVPRCDKDDYYLNDQVYAYYQIAVIILFTTLFICLALLYGTILTFVWRHESLMFERYGSDSKFRRYRVRLHHSANSHKRSAASSKEVKITKDKGGSKSKSASSVAANESKSERLRCACLCDSSEIDLSPSTQASYVQHSLLINDDGKTLIQPHDKSQSREQEKPLEVADKHVDKLGDKTNKCFCLPYQESSDSNTGLFEVQDKTSLNRQGDIELTLSRQTSGQAKPNWPHNQSVCLRRPHVHTAVAFGFIATAFVLSYTPYLVFSAISAIRQKPLTNQDDERWHIQIGRIFFYLYFTNSAVNPIIYSFMNRHFRGRMRHLFGQCRNACKRFRAQESKQFDTNDLAEIPAGQPLRKFSKSCDSTFENTGQKSPDDCKAFQVVKSS